ncbi:MAG: tRNA (adenosine(37)-N6)-threonylcarbamoyltransferase complex dimerization subunit type 1 TsaB [Candidatus Goldbacteria bacterium]|nr:tRNA (adenosine(37)-N6)-threonylcarbamoyltransferase complex dimerization subunit type 1 TsaB [Candidatus Goldiibacteriota bacterium]
MIKLLVDTSGKEIGIGLFKDKQCLYEEYKIAEKTYNKIIIPLIDKTIKEGGVDIKDINLFGATLGPGSFTGIRVGVAVMKALSQVLNKKFYGIPVPDILAENSRTDCEKVVLMDAGRQEFYFARYNNKDKINYELLDTRKLIKKIKKNDVIIFLENDLYVKEFVLKQFKNNMVITPSHIDIKIFNDIIEKNKQETNNFIPVYIRQPDAEKNLKREKNE